MKRLACLTLGLITACTAPPADVAPRSAPVRVVLFIGDGVGTSYWSAARFASRDLAVAAFPVAALVDTRNHEGRITDSAAGATAYSAGVLTYNGAIGVGPDSLPRRTLVELAESLGMSTGLVATSSVTHATPASFAAHVVDRDMHQEIAAHMAEAGLEVLLGGGAQYFTAALRRDGRDLLAPLLAGAAWVETGAQLHALAQNPSKLVGFFAPDALPPAADRRDPTLADMTRAAIATLGLDPDGFFLMVEASQPDWRGHDNEPLERLTAEMLDFDEAVRVAADYARATPGTLIVIAADHETGGMALAEDSAGRYVARYVSRDHTGEMVPLLALGEGAARFGGMHGAAAVGRMLAEHIARRRE